MSAKTKKLPLVPIGRNVQSAETGTWRTFKPKINKKMCKKCGICAMFCPEGVILRLDGDFEIDYTFCKGCGICASECSAKAIEMVLDE